MLRLDLYINNWHTFRILPLMARFVFLFLFLAHFSNAQTLTEVEKTPLKVDSFIGF